MLSANQTHVNGDFLNASQERRTSSNVFLIGIAGPSGSGKSTLARQLAEELGSPVLPISSDWYNGARPIKEKKDWEKPESHDFGALINDIKHVTEALSSSQGPPTVLHVGRPNQQRHRDIMAQHKRPASRRFPRIPVIVEGFLLFYDETLSNMFDARIWLEADPQECMQRRYHRRPKGDLDTFARFYQDIVWSHYLKYRETQLLHAGTTFQVDAHHEMDALTKQVAAHCFDLARTGTEQKSASREKQGLSPFEERAAESAETCGETGRRSRRRWQHNVLSNGA